jgi:hypothetical protein
MEGKIDHGGHLLITRGKVENKTQFCPFTPCEPGDIPQCGDWCPLFGELGEEVGGYRDLFICQDRHLAFSKIEDDRTK